MKRWITSLLAILLVLVLAACGSQQQSTDAESEKSKSGKLRIADSDLFDDSYSIAVSKDNPDLLSRINQALTELKESKTIDRIEQYYVSGRGSRPENTYIAPDDAEVLTMGTCADLPPYIYYEDGEIAGVDVAIAQCIAEKLGMKLEIVDMPYDAIVHKVASGEIDIGMAAMTITADTSAVVNFSKSYSGSNETLIVPGDSEIGTIGAVYDLVFKEAQPVRIGAVRDSVACLYISDQFGESHMKVFENHMDALQALEQGELDCVIMDTASAQYYLKTMH